MAIVHMKKLRLMVVRRQKDELLRDLMLLGCVQISEPDALLADAESAAVLRQESGNVTEVRSELTRLTAALKLLDKYAPVKSKLLSSRPEVTEREFLDVGAYRKELDAVAQLEELEAAVRRYNGEEAKLRSNMEALRPWQTLDLPLDLGETVRTRISLGMLPAAVDLAETAKALADAAPESQLYEISSDKEQHYVLLICLKEELTEAITALRASGFTLANLNGAPGTAKQNIEDAQQQIADVTRRREQAETDIAAFAPHRDAFKLCIDRASVKLGRAEAEERLVGTESVVCMRGWLTAPEEAKLTAVLAKYDCAWDLADPTEDEYPEVPVKLQNNKFTEPLNMVTNMYSLPAYGTVDPNPLMAPFFILFYGIMMADMGYGLVMMIAALVALGKMKPKRGSKYFCELLFACGVSTFLLGIVTGGFFGNAVPTIVKMFGHDVKLGILTSPLLDPLTDTTTILIGAMVLGFIQLVTGMIVNMVMECRQGKVGDAIFNEGTWFVIFAGLALFVLKIGNIGGVPVVLCIGVLMLIYGSGRDAKGFGKVTAVFGAVYNGLTGWFGDILSYSRLMALMLAGSVIAQVFNTLAAMPSSGGVTVVSMIVFIIIFLLGHLLNFGLNLLGCFVHDLRLQCLEFFGKFYVDGGKPFSPLEVVARVKAQLRRATPTMVSQGMLMRRMVSTRSEPSSTMPKPPLMAFPTPTPPPLCRAIRLIPRAAFPA